MSQLTGTLVISPITPPTTEDTYGTHFAKYGVGGYRTVSTIDERDSIPEARRENLMLVAVESLNKIYQLSGSLSNSGWIEFSIGGSGGGSISGDFVSKLGDMMSGSLGFSTNTNPTPISLYPVNFSGPNIQIINPTGSLVTVSYLNLQAGRIVYLRINRSDTGYSLNIPTGSVFFSGGPTNCVPANKIVGLSLSCAGILESEVDVAFVIEK